MRLLVFASCPRRVVLSLVLLAASGGPLAAQAEDLHPACMAATARITLALKPGTAMPDLASLLASATCKSVVFTADADRCATTVTIIAPRPLAPGQVAQVVIDALGAMGLSVTQSRSSIVVKPASGTTCPALTARPGAGTALASPAAGGGGTAPRVTEAEMARGIRRKSATEFEVDRELVVRVLAEPPLLRTSAHVRPEEVGGKRTGLRISAVRSGALWDRLGVQNGDLLLRSNGLPLTSSEKVLQAYVAARKASTITLELQRQGKTLQLRYLVR